MKQDLIKSIIKEILKETFLKSINLSEISIDANITIIFQNNELNLKKISENRFEVKSIKVSDKIKQGDQLEFMDKLLEINKKEKCNIFRKNKIGKFLKIDIIHEFAPIKSIEVF
jgi:hypothetical protein